MPLQLRKGLASCAALSFLLFPVSGAAAQPDPIFPKIIGEATASGNTAGVTVTGNIPGSSSNSNGVGGSWSAEAPTGAGGASIEDLAAAELSKCRPLSKTPYPGMLWKCPRAEPEQAEIAPTAIDVPAVAISVAASLRVPEPAIRLEPEASWNKWNVLAVGLPIWAWSDDAGQLSTAVTSQGIDITLSATRSVVRFDWGDGTTSVCQSMTPRPRNVDPLKKSPDCGHTYLKRGDYTVTASAQWVVVWSAAGQTGQLELTSSGTGQPIPIREFETVVVG